MLKSMDSLFHFTKGLNVLFSILSNGFTGSYCKEVFRYGDSELEQYVPKISFCDLTENTLSEYKNYGNYGIGIRKDWGKEKGLNPVLYMENNSLISKIFIEGFTSSRTAYNFIGEVNETIGQIWRESKNFAEHDLSLFARNTLIAKDYNHKLKATLNTLNYHNYSLLYIKPYDGYLLKEGESENYCFYDEREWCYVPEMNEFLSKYNINKEEYIEWRGNINENKRLLDDLKLIFKFTDVTHLLVKDESDITELKNKIDQLDNSIISIEDKERLKSLIKIF